MYGIFSYPFCPCLFNRGANHGIIHVNSRYRRDARSMEEDEETWFDGDEENGDDTVLPAEDFLENDDREFKTRKAFITANKTTKLSNDQTVNNKTVSNSAVIEGRGVVLDYFQKELLHHNYIHLICPRKTKPKQQRRKNTANYC